MGKLAGKIALVTGGNSGIGFATAKQFVREGDRKKRRRSFVRTWTTDLKGRHMFVLAAIYRRAASALLILGALAGAMQLLDAGIGLFEHDLGKSVGPLFIAVLQFFVVRVLHRSTRITTENQARI